MGRLRRGMLRGRRQSLKQHGQELRQKKAPYRLPPDDLVITRNMPMPQTEWTIFIRLLNGRVFTIICHPYDRVIDIRRKIWMKEGVSGDQQNLFYCGLRLGDGPIRDYKIDDNSVIYLTLRLRGG